MKRREAWTIHNPFSDKEGTFPMEYYVDSWQLPENDG